MGGLHTKCRATGRANRGRNEVLFQYNSNFDTILLAIENIANLTDRPPNRYRPVTKIGARVGNKIGKDNLRPAVGQPPMGLMWTQHCSPPERFNTAAARVITVSL